MAIQIQNDNVRISGDEPAFCNIGIQEFSALLQEHLDEDPLTRFVEGIATEYVANGMPQARTQFVVRLICAWGGLRGRNPTIIYETNVVNDFHHLTQALIAARNCSLQGQYAEGIGHIMETPGIGISFASKFLKFLCPNHAAVLDLKIRSKLKYPETADGYAALVRDCVAIRTDLNNRGLLRDAGEPWRASDVEMAIFRKIR